MAIAIKWIADEFSVHQDERLTVQDKNGDEYSVTIKELFDIIYEDRLNEITVQAKKEILESIQELKNEYS